MAARVAEAAQRVVFAEKGHVWPGDSAPCNKSGRHSRDTELDLKPALLDESAEQPRRLDLLEADLCQRVDRARGSEQVACGAAYHVMDRRVQVGHAGRGHRLLLTYWPADEEVADRVSHEIPNSSEGTSLSRSYESTNPPMIAPSAELAPC